MPTLQAVPPNHLVSSHRTTAVTRGSPMWVATDPMGPHCLVQVEEEQPTPLINPLQMCLGEVLEHFPMEAQEIQEAIQQQMLETRRPL